MTTTCTKKAIRPQPTYFLTIHLNDETGQLESDFAGPFTTDADVKAIRKYAAARSDLLCQLTVRDGGKLAVREIEGALCG